MKHSLSYGAPRSFRTTVLAIVCAAMLILMLLTQLYGYEDFGVILLEVLPFNDQPLATAFAAGIVLIELLALPYLLGIYISKLMRGISIAAAITSVGFWLVISLTNAHAINSGLFSSTFELPGGILAALCSLLLTALLVSVLSADSRFRHDASS